ncbi:MAG: response regulator [Candidatus Omnitrophica bacterium]|nr:response regulator [Candidatus Omnitrophota bacterium]
MITKVLIVDDEPDIVAVMKFTLESKGFKVITAYDGLEGLKKAKEENPDLIILDVLMPKVFGDDLAVKLKSEPDTYNIPIILLTNLPLDFLAGKDGSNSSFSRDSRGNIYLPKTCSEEQLLAAINSLINNA